MESGIISNIVDDLYPVYIEKLEKGEYLIPPLLIISEILQNKYAEENLHLHYNISDFNIFTNTEFLKTKEAFKSLVFSKELSITSSEEWVSTVNSDGFIDSLFFIHNAYLTVYVKYPEIIIKNSDNKSHKIRDLYIKVIFNYNGTLKQSFRILRSTFTEKELLEGYSHSHIRSICYKNSGYLDKLQEWKTPCLGSGTLLSSLTTTLDYPSFDETNIMAYFEAIDAFLAWESLEGGPYMKISNIGYENINNITPSVSRPLYNPEIELVVHLIQDEYFMSQFELVPTIIINCAKYDIKINEPFMAQYITLLSKKLGLFQEIEKNNNVVYYHIDDFNNIKYFRIFNRENIHNIKKYKNAYLFSFKNESVRLNIIEDSEKPQHKQTIHPNILHYILEFLKQYITKKNGKNKFADSAI